MPTTPDRARLMKIEAANKKLTEENKKLAKDLETHKAATTRLSQTEKSLQSKVQTLQTQNSALSAELKQSLKENTTKTLLRKNPLVQEMINLEKGRLETEISKKNDEISALNVKLDALLKVTKIKPLQKGEFNRFLSTSIQELQTELAAGSGEYEFVVRDLEIEANVMVELRGNQPVYVLPTTEQLNEVDPRMMNRLKYALSVVPKE
ncbi:hypothetical protein ACXWTF_00225 [Thiomicrolovo sp. ZZH C-3]